MKRLLFLIALLWISAGCQSASAAETTGNPPSPVKLTLPPEWTSTPIPTFSPTPEPVPSSTLTPTDSPTTRPTRDPNCRIADQFAYIGGDGNVYVYDVCQGAAERLTAGGAPPWYFPGESDEIWCGDRLLLGRNNFIHVLEMQTLSVTQLGTNPHEQAIWSPSCHWIALFDYAGRITIVDSSDYSQRADWEGFAPDWLSDEELFFFTPPQDTDADPIVQHSRKYNIVTRSTSPVNASYESGGIYMGPTVFGKLSPGNRYFVYSGYAVESSVTVGIMDLQAKKNFHPGSYVVMGTLIAPPNRPLFSWSPADPVLAVCAHPTMGDPMYKEMIVGLYLDAFSADAVHISKECTGTPAWDPTGGFFSYIHVDYDTSDWTISAVVAEIVAREGRVEKSFSLPKDLIFCHYGEAYIVCGSAWSSDGGHFSVLIGGRVFLAATDWRNADLRFLIEANDLRWRFQR